MIRRFAAMVCRKARERAFFVATGLRQHRRVPYYAQRTVTDCGAACLRSVLPAHGTRVDVWELDQAFGSGRDGAHAATILRVARGYGLTSSFACRLEPTELAGVPMPAILHWDFHHFVVLERYSVLKGALIVDPSRGRRWVNHADLDARFTGVALFFVPGP